MSGVRVIVIGAGFGGLGAAIALQRAGNAEVTVLEKADGIGGVWRENTYPGAACDVPSALYSWSFAPNRRWGRRYSPQPEILDYIRRTAQQEGILDRVRTGVEVQCCDWVDGEWRVTTDAGELRADVLVPAVGQLSRPVIPRIPGIEDFAGPAFHSAQWRHDVPLAGRRVAVVGTGASAIQFVPRIAPEAEHVTVFQRSAPYVVPKPDGAHGPLHRLLSDRTPFGRAERGTVFGLTEIVNHMLLADSVGTKALHALWAAHLRLRVRDAELRRTLTPDYPLGCKRLLFSNDWYPTLDRDDVSVVADDVTGVEPTGLRTADGRLHEADVLIWGTGFAAAEVLGPIEVTAQGTSLREAWADGASAHLGITVPGFPNLFVMYGPNTNLGGSSIIGMLEAQAGYLVQAVDDIGRRGPRQVRREVFEAWDEEIQGRLGESVWAQCESWYRVEGGRITTNWPGQVMEYQRRTARFDPTEYEPA